MNTKKNLVNRLILGGAQIGQSYGQFSNTKLLDKDYAINYIKKAIDIGIEKIDIAEDYNFNFIESLKFDNKIFINKFKTSSFINLHEQDLLAFDEIFIHDTEFLKDENKNSFILKYEQLKSKLKIGFSIYDIEEIYQILNIDSRPHAFQVPDNILSQTFITKEFNDLKKNHNFKIYVRSVFLQGMIIAPEKKIPNKMGIIKDEILRFKRFCISKDCRAEIAALNFAFTNEVYDKVIIGCNNLTQLLDLYKKISFIEKNNIEIKYKPHLNAKTLDPRNW